MMGSFLIFSYNLLFLHVHQLFGWKISLRLTTKLFSKLTTFCFDNQP